MGFPNRMRFNSKLVSFFGDRLLTKFISRCYFYICKFPEFIHPIFGILVARGANSLECPENVFEIRQLYRRQGSATAALWRFEEGGITGRLQTKVCSTSLLAMQSTATPIEPSIRKMYKTPSDGYVCKLSAFSAFSMVGRIEDSHLPANKNIASDRTWFLNISGERDTVAT